MESRELNEAGQFPDYNIGRRWLVENYEGFHTRLVTAMDYWARSIKNDYEVNMKLWQSMNRVLFLIRYRKPVVVMGNYKHIVEKWDTYNKNYKIPSKDIIMELASFLNEALYYLKVVYDEEVEKDYISPYYHGSEA